MDDALGTDPDAHRSALVRDLVEVRAGLIEALSEMSESWLMRLTNEVTDVPGRLGWTVQHEAAHHFADDVVLMRLLEQAAAGVEVWTRVEARRLRGEAMHVTQRMRLAELRDHLVASGERAVTAIEAGAPHLYRPFAIGEAAPTPILEVLRAQSTRARSGVVGIRRAFGLA